jgi:hypothetical protein
MANPEIHNYTPEEKTKYHMANQPTPNTTSRHHQTTNRILQITHAYCSSPLTCPTQLTQYNSPHNKDIKFGSMGYTKSSRWLGIGLAFPQDHNSTLEAIHWARMAAKEDNQTITILIVNYKDWTTPQLPIIG